MSSYMGKVPPIGLLLAGMAYNSAVRCAEEAFRPLCQHRLSSISKWDANRESSPSIVHGVDKPTLFGSRHGRTYVRSK